MTQKAIKAQVFADNLAENLVDEELNCEKLIFTMNKCHLWVKIFLNHTPVRDYSLMQRKIIKVKVLEKS